MTLIGRVIRAIIGNFSAQLVILCDGNSSFRACAIVPCNWFRQYYLNGSDACKVRSESGIIEITSYEYDGLKILAEEAVTTGNSTDTYAYEYDDYGYRSKITAEGTED